MLIREIASGRLPNGARLPTEREMAKEYNVAVGTLRKALQVLEEKGLLKRVQGSGNYIQAKADIDSIYSFFRLERVSGAGLPTAKALSVDRMKRPEQAKAFRSKSAHRIRRLRYLDGRAIAAEEIWLDADYAKHVALTDLSESLYYFYKNKYGLVVSRVEDRVSSSGLPNWAPAELDLAAGEPCGFIERFSYDQENRMCEYSHTWFDSSKARYVVRLV